MSELSEGRAVREAYDGPEITYDDFIGHHEDQKRYEEASASKMGEARQQRGEFLENTGLNGKAVSAVRVGLKIKDEAKRQGWLRSMKALIEIAEANIDGNTTKDWIEDEENDAADAAEDEEDSNVVPAFGS